MSTINSSEPGQLFRRTLDHQHFERPTSVVPPRAGFAAPYFRIFNPVTQGEKSDAQGEYTRKYVPELANLPDKYLLKPRQAPAETLQAAGVEPGTTYPHPIIDLKPSRNRALEAYAHVKNR